MMLAMCLLCDTHTHIYTRVPKKCIVSYTSTTIEEFPRCSGIGENSLFIALENARIISIILQNFEGERESERIKRVLTCVCVCMCVEFGKCKWRCAMYFMICVIVV